MIRTARWKTALWLPLCAPLALLMLLLFVGSLAAFDSPPLLRIGSALMGGGLACLFGALAIRMFRLMLRPGSITLSRDGLAIRTTGPERLWPWDQVFDVRPGTRYRPFTFGGRDRYGLRRLEPIWEIGLRQLAPLLEQGRARWGPPPTVRSQAVETPSAHYWVTAGSFVALAAGAVLVLFYRPPAPSPGAGSPAATPIASAQAAHLQTRPTVRRP